MRRHPGLRGLSDDHHRGLVNARRLKRAAAAEEAERADAAGKFLGFWRADTRLHFREEEDVLLPVLARHAGNLSHPSVVEMLTQHARIRGLAMDLEDELGRRGVRGETLRELGERLEAHIRLEERRVFPYIEETLPEHALEEVASRLEAFEV